MKGQFSPLAETCRQALAEIEVDPLELTPVTAAHVRTCHACAETRVAWLAQEETQAQAPAGYFERLPDRILSKLPVRTRSRRPHFALWAMAAAVLLAVGVGGFWAGRANRAPMVEATLAPATVETHDTLPDTPFLEGEEDYVQLPNLSPEEAHALIERVRSQDSRP